jgi:serine/threonine protein phosphatase PrpC
MKAPNSLTVPSSPRPNVVVEMTTLEYQIPLGQPQPDTDARAPTVVVEHAAVTDRGLRRARNEDAFLADPPIFAVADGMGGPRAGHVASRLAIQAIETSQVATLASSGGLAECVRTANQKVHTAGETVLAYAGMGTTLTAAAAIDGLVHVAHVGDSRLYRLRDGRLEQLTRDHTVVAEMVRDGRLPREEAGGHRWRSILSRAVGIELGVEIDSVTLPAQIGDVYLLCSDGLTKMLAADEISSVLVAASSLDAAARTLLDSANARGGRDNITAVLFRLGADPSSGTTS